jgi:hypothetical protein
MNNRKKPAAPTTSRAKRKKVVPARRDTTARTERLQDQTLICCERDCAAQFLFTVLEQKFFAANGFTPPKRCKACRTGKNAAIDAVARQHEQAFEEARAIGMALHDESEADDDGFIPGAGFDRYGGFPGDGLS